MSSNDCATGTFVNIGTGLLDEAELEIINSDTGFESGTLDLEQVSTGATAAATFTDLNADGFADFIGHLWIFRLVS